LNALNFLQNGLRSAIAVYACASSDAELDEISVCDYALRS